MALHALLRVRRQRQGPHTVTGDTLVPENVLGNVHENVPENVPKNVPENVPENVPRGNQSCRQSSTRQA